jgi:hypothetical protein
VPIRRKNLLRRPATALREDSRLWYSPNGFTMLG